MSALSRNDRGPDPLTILERVRAEAASVLGLPSASAIDPQRTFADQGFNSLAGVELASRLERLTGLELPPTLGFEYPTPAAAAEFLSVALEGVRAATAAETPTASGRGAADEDIAIVGMSCRYPGGVRGPEELWRLLASETDAISDFPSDRGWDLEAPFHSAPEHLHTTYAREGGFIEDATCFDAEFFSISPHEARAMDPQQRLLLEAGWEAFEDAGLDVTSLKGSRTGVFVGLATHDYLAAHANMVPTALEPFFGIGNAGSVATGRVAYTLGFTGPAITFDTACSSSLVALHYACQALRLHECSLALAGGVTVMANPSIFVESARQRVLSRDARCRSFAASANGAVWSEGVGLILVERLREAQRLGHRVLAIVRGSAVNQDGTSNGLTAPNGRAQEQVIRQALANARLKPRDVDAVEGHGTGTPLGDPIEARALLATYGRDRERPLRLGSLKSNIGHSQAAGGIGGLIKMVLAMRHELLPRTLHLDQPSAHVDWSSGSVSLLAEAEPWPRADSPRRAGISAFALSGTNAHVILEEAPSVVAEPEPPLGQIVPWVLSAKSEPALDRQIASLRRHLEQNPGLRPADVARSLLAKPSFQHRAAVIGANAADLLIRLDAVGRGEASDRGVRGVAAERSRVVFVLPGHGCHWEGMARELLACSPPFAEQLLACAEALDPLTGWSLEAVLRGDADAPPLDRVDVVQPALFAMMVSLARVWRRAGVEPSVVVGHSLGEVVAAHLAGGLSLEDAARLVASRGRALATLAGRGAMAAIALPAERLRDRIEPFATKITVAAVNGPSATVVSGEPGAISELLEQCAADRVWARPIPVDYASHSSQIDEVGEQFVGALASIQPRPGEIPFVSTVTGELADTNNLHAEHWHANLRQTVQFERAIRGLALRGYRTFIEVSPHPILTMAIADTLDSVGAEAGAVFGSLRRDDGGLERLLASAAEAHVAGVSVDLGAFFNGHRVGLPTYAFKRERFWLDGAGSGQARPPREVSGASDPDEGLAGRGDAPRRDLGELSSEEREAFALELVRGYAAGILGHASAEHLDPERSLFDLGLDSLGLLDLRTRVARATGTPPVPESVFLDDPTPRALAGYIASSPSPLREGSRHATDHDSATRGAGETFSELLRAADDVDAILALTRTLMAASRLRAAFHLSDELPPRPRTVAISHGRRAPRLFCVPSFLPGSGPQQFVRFAAAFSRTRPISAVRLPGLDEGDRLPASLDVAIQAMVEAVLAEAEAEPFVLVGYSAGGALAHAMAERLEPDTPTLAGLVLLDSYELAGDAAAEAFASAMRQILTRAHDAAPIDDDKLLAMGAYIRLLEQWTPRPVQTPSLLLKASVSLGSAPPWGLAHEVVKVRGDHFSLIESDAVGTASAARHWLEAQQSSGHLMTQAAVG